MIVDLVLGVFSHNEAFTCNQNSIYSRLEACGGNELGRTDMSKWLDILEL